MNINSASDALSKSMTGKTARENIEQKLCPCCGKPIGKFRDALSEREYNISGMCQACQDSVFGE